MTAWFLEASLEAGRYGMGALLKRREQAMGTWSICCHSFCLSRFTGRYSHLKFLEAG